MDYKKFGDTIYVRLNRRDEIISNIIDICKKENVLSATYSGIGCCSDIVVSSYIPEKDEFLEHKESGVLELISLNGNISANENDEIFHHTHAMFSFHDSDYKLALTGGHLIKAVVLYTAEIVINPVLNGVIRRKKDEITGIIVWDI